jgi:hypothetical protein
MNRNALHHRWRKLFTLFTLCDTFRIIFRKFGYKVGYMKRLWVDLRDRPRGVLRLYDAGAGDGTRTRTGLPPTVFKPLNRLGRTMSIAVFSHHKAKVHSGCWSVKGHHGPPVAPVVAPNSPNSLPHHDAMHTPLLPRSFTSWIT